jgi:hypothetical protein
MPTNQGFRRHNDKGPLPSRPKFASENPKQSVYRAEPSSWVSPLQGCQLLAKGEVFEQQAASRTEYSPECGQKD